MDIRAFLFEPLLGRSFVAELTATEPGILAGSPFTRSRAEEIGLHIEMAARDGIPLAKGSCVLRVRGPAEEIARGEEELLACVGKPSGVATATARYCALAGGKARIVCGAWKKVAPEVRKPLREAIATGGGGIRLTDDPFVYLDKNYVRMFSDIGAAVRRAVQIEGRTVAVQLKGNTDSIAGETRKAFQAGAGILMVDTGNLDDLKAAVETARAEGFRDRVRVAFAGGGNGREHRSSHRGGRRYRGRGTAHYRRPASRFSLRRNRPRLHLAAIKRGLTDMEWNLLEKTTFWVDGADLLDAHLGEVADAAAAGLNLEPGEVMVVDVQPGIVAFDILRQTLDADSVAGKAEEILRRLSCVHGVHLSENASIHSEGVLGFIALDRETARSVMEKSKEMGDAVADAVSRRACIFASGSEVIAGSIEDTNSPHLIKALTEAGFHAEFGGIIEDDTAKAASALEAALMKGFGLIITTGGVGAEKKDHSVEAILRLDPSAHTPWILKFTPDMRRHHKEGVRIALGRVGICRLIALPGPHEEVRAGCRALLEGLKSGLEDGPLSDAVATSIRERWINHMHKEAHTHGH